MSAVGDLFQNLGSVMTFGIIPPAMPDIPELSMEDMDKITNNALSQLDTKLGDFSPDKITSDVDSLLKSLSLGDLGSMGQPPVLPTDTSNPSTPNTSTSPNTYKTYIPNNPMNPY